MVTRTSLLRSTAVCPETLKLFVQLFALGALAAWGAGGAVGGGRERWLALMGGVGITVAMTRVSWLGTRCGRQTHARLLVTAVGVMTASLLVGFAWELDEGDLTTPRVSLHVFAALWLATATWVAGLSGHRSAATERLLPLVAALWVAPSLAPARHVERAQVDQQLGGLSEGSATTEEHSEHGLGAASAAALGVSVVLVHLRRR